MTNSNKPPNKSSAPIDEQGFVAMITCLLLSIIITIITVSFVRIMQREQRQALDRQLSTQAFYAAESGANYAIKKDIANKTTCDTPGTGTLDANQVVKFTCLLVNETPEELVFDGINTEKPTVFSISQPVSELEFFWEGPAGTETWRAPSNYPTLYNLNDWGSNIGIVEVVVYPIKSTIDVNDLRSSSRTYYLYPTTGGGNVDYSEDAQVVRAHCDPGRSATKPKKCRVTLSGLSGSGATGGYVLRLRSIYNPVSLQINGEDAAGTRLALRGAQRVIDVTGKAGDVLRRIQIRLPIRSGYALPIFAIEAGENLCKLQDTYPGGGTEDPACL